MTPDVFTRRVALIASIAATWTFENVTTAEVYDGKLPEGAAKRFADRIRPIIDEIEGLSTAPPDGAAEREKLSTENLLDRIYHFEMWARDSWKDEGIASVLHDAAAKIAALSNPTPAPTEAPAAKRDGVRDEAFFVWETLATPERPIDLRSFRAGWSAALAARPAAVTDAMVETGASALYAVRNTEFAAPWEKIGDTQDDYRIEARTVLLAARGPA